MKTNKSKHSQGKFKSVSPVNAAGKGKRGRGSPKAAAVLDCQWLQQLHTYGLLRGAFRPEAAVRRLRALSRHRADLVAEGGSHLQQAQKALVQMNVQLPLVVSDINGETGLRIIETILKGERHAQELVKLRDPRIPKSTVAEMEAALNGHYTEELVFVLGQNIEAWKFHQKQMEACDQPIESALKAMASASKAEAPPAPPKPVPPAAPGSPGAKAKRQRPLHGNNAPKVDFSEQIRRVSGRQNQRGQKVKPQDPACCESSLGPLALSGSGGRTDRNLDWTFLLAQESSLGRTQGHHRHGPQTGLCHLPHVEV